MSSSSQESFPLVHYDAFCQPCDIDDIHGPGSRIAIARMPEIIDLERPRLFGNVVPFNFTREFRNYVPEMYLVKLNNAIICERQILISEERGLLPDSFRKYNNNSGWVPQTSPGNFTPKLETSPSLSLDGIYFYLDGAHAGNFGHFLLEVLSRLWIVDRINISNIKFLVHRQFFKKYMMAYLAPLGVTEDNIVKFEGSVKCESILIARQACVLSRYLSPLIKPLWYKIGEFYPGVVAGQEKVYFSRSKVKSRPLTNEIEVEELLKKFGFSIFHPQTHSVGEQISVINSAKKIITPAGSGTHQFGFSQAHPNKLVITSDKFYRQEDILINGVCGGNLSYCCGIVNDPAISHLEGITAPWTIDIPTLRAAVEEWIDT